MTKKGLRFPHTISYRLTDEDFLKLEQEVNETGLTAHDWCRLVVLDRLNQEYALSRNERFLFAQVARIQYLVSIGFQMLADDKLSTEQWRKIRVFAKENVNVVAYKTMKDFRSRTASEGRGAGSSR
ncbi:MAG: hypothetical protein ND866_07945 [Pyrinomonadaceae bacterium]|nr:hypothetical protein [Pyrinomonadaceae bacterium]